jgi:hypothetical protein
MFNVLLGNAGTDPKFDTDHDRTIGRPIILSINDAPHTRESFETSEQSPYTATELGWMIIVSSASGKSFLQLP